MAGSFFHYGTAAHLAILTVAPLFLHAVCGAALQAAFLAWLSVFAALWVVMNPAARMGEWPRDARRRIVWELMRDPFFSFGVVALVIAAVRAINGGVALTYDVSAHLWHLTEPFVPLLPGSVSGEGLLPLAGVFALIVVTLGVRHALDTRTRFYYLLFSGLLAAAAVGVWWGLSAHGVAVPRLKTLPAVPYGLGTLLGGFFLLSVVAWVESWFRSGSVPELLAVLSTGILLAGLLLYAPTFALWAFLPLGLALVATGGVLAFSRRPLRIWARTAVLLLIVLFPVALLVSGEIARPALWPILTKEFLALREAASAVALAGWKSATQLGLGLGAYPSAMGFYATAENWQVLTTAQVAAPNGWVQFLFERGLLGAIVSLAGLALLIRDVVLRYVRAGSDWRLSAVHLVGPVVLAAAVAVLFFDCSYIQIEALLPVGAALGLTAAALPDAVEEDHG